MTPDKHPSSHATNASSAPPSTEVPPHWTRVLDLAAVTADAPQVVKLQGKQIAVFRVANRQPEEGHLDKGQVDGGTDEIRAIDNRCPHEGYPLHPGAVKEGVLTCEWHNWKFRLQDGACILGGEDVHAYPVLVANGGIWLDLREPERANLLPPLYRSIDRGFEEGDFGQVARTIERLLAAGATATEILAHGCRWGAEHAPYGFDHGLATAADIAAILATVRPPLNGDSDGDGDGNGNGDGNILLQGLSLIAEPNLRRLTRQWGSVTDAGPAMPATLTLADDNVEIALRRHIEDEDLAGAESLIRSAIAAGAGPDDVFTWLNHAATDHFLGFGHGHIYTVKAEELCRLIGWEHAHPIVTSLVSSLIYQTREDRLPYMRGYHKHMAPYRDLFVDWAQREHRGGKTPPPNVDRVVHAVLDGSLAEALAAVADELARGVAGYPLALCLSLAAAERVLRFDAALEHQDHIAEGWLHVTHALTHADAVAETLRLRPSADTLRGLFHSARFIQHMHPCDMGSSDLPQEARAAALAGNIGKGLHGATAADLAAKLTAALERRSADCATTITAAGLASIDSADDVSRSPIANALRQHVLGDAATMPIFVTHHIKMVMAGLRLSTALKAAIDKGLLPNGRHSHTLPTAAAARFIASPLRERRIARRAQIAREFVVNGQQQASLLGY